MTPRSRLRTWNLIHDYRAELLEGVAQWVEQLEIASGSCPVELQAKIAFHIREAKL